MTSNVPANRTEAKPAPAVGQIWRYDCMTPEYQGTHTVRSVEDGVVYFRDYDGAPLVRYLTGSGGWSCIGVETLHGRVMVGERRISDHPTADDPRVTVERISNHGHVVLRPAGASFVVGQSAERVATWPLVTEPAKPEPCCRYAGRDHICERGGVPLGSTAGEWAETVAIVPPEHAERAREIVEAASRSIDRALTGTGIPATAPTSPPDSRNDREWRRRQIDAVLREDAQRFPAFAIARRCAVMAACERHQAENGPQSAEYMLECLRVYEASRGGGKAPSALAVRLRDGWGDPTIVDVYERARSLP